MILAEIVQLVRTCKKSKLELVNYCLHEDTQRLRTLYTQTQFTVEHCNWNCHLEHYITVTGGQFNRQFHPMSVLSITIFSLSNTTFPWCIFGWTFGH